MIDDFMLRALLTGIAIAAVAAPLGALVLWRRMAYFGDTLAHSALLGTVLAYTLSIPPMAGVFLCALGIGLALYIARKQDFITNDALLGIMSHASLAVSLVAISLSGQFRPNILSFLFGDILTVTWQDVAITWLGGVIILMILARMWSALIAATISRDLATSEGQRPDRSEFWLMVLMAALIAISMKLIGVLLITSLLIIPAAAARAVSRTPEQMAAMAAVIGVVAVFAGLGLSLGFDTPSGPSIVVAALAIFLLSLLLPRRN